VPSQSALPREGQKGLSIPRERKSGCDTSGTGFRLSTHDQTTILQGRCVSGKTTALQRIAEIAAASGYEVVGLAPTGTATLMKVVFALFLSIGIACAQGSLLWVPATSAPLIANRQTPGVFYVSSYYPQGTHTDYDMARQTADAYAAAHPWTGSVLVLNPTTNQTCDAVPLPSLGTDTGKMGNHIDYRIRLERQQYRENRLSARRARPLRAILIRPTHS
jgi:AAA domain